MRSIHAFCALVLFALPALAANTKPQPKGSPRGGILKLQQESKINNELFARLPSEGLGKPDLAVNLLRAKHRFDAIAVETKDPDERKAAKDNAARALRQSEMIADLETRIAGTNAKKAKENQFPFQVALVLAGIADPALAQFCGGSLVRKNRVLTAAHCLRADTKPEDLEVYWGSNKLSGGGKRFKVVKIVRNAAYDEDTNENDAAVLHLAAEIDGTTVTLGAPSNATLVAAGAKAIVSGWGDTYEGSGSGSDDLLYAIVSIIDTTMCNAPESYAGRIKTTMLCAGDSKGDSCQGDSGGPLVASTPEGFVQVGIVSWGDGCARRTKYGVYSSVPALLSWITQSL